MTTKTKPKTTAKLATKEKETTAVTKPPKAKPAVRVTVRPKFPDVVVHANGKNAFQFMRDAIRALEGAGAPIEDRIAYQAAALKSPASIVAETKRFMTVL